MHLDLDQLFEAVQEINCRESLVSFMADLERSSREILGHPRVRILHPDETGHFSTRPGPKQLKLSESRALDTPCFLSNSRSKELLSGEDPTLLIPLLAEDKVLLGYLALVGVQEDFQVRSQTDLETLCTVAALAVSRAYRASELKKKETEMAYAWEVLQTLLPAEHLELQGFDCSGLLIPAKEVGGDIYDYFSVSKDRLAFIIADAAGKGTGPCLQAATCRAYFRALVTGESTDLSSIAARLNRLLCQDVKADKFVTACFGWLNTDTGQITYINAGHGSGYFASSKTSEPIGVSDPPLGVLEMLEYTSHHRRLEVGESLALFTDGWTERLIDEVEEYGEERLEKSLEESVKSSHELLRRAYQSYEIACLETHQNDDVTALILGRH